MTTVDEILQDMDKSTMFSKFDINGHFIKLNLNQNPKK